MAKTEGSKILAAIPMVGVESEPETDCSHLVHDIYEKAGFPYDYVTSRELYIGSANFTRVRAPQPGDLVVWRGHVGIVVDPEQHSFFSFVHSGPDTQFYDSPYWRSRGIARFYRYLTEKPLQDRRAVEAASRAEQQSLPDDSRTSQSPPPSRGAIYGPAPALKPATTLRDSGPIVFQVAGKSPLPEEIAAAFVETNRDFGESLRTRRLSSLGKPVVVYRELRVSAMQIKGKHGTALVRIESLGASAGTQALSPSGWQEQSLEFEKTKRGWVLHPLQDAAYIKREIALEVLSARLAELARNTEATGEQEHEQKEIIRLLSWLVPDDSNIASAPSN